MHETLVGLTLTAVVALAGAGAGGFVGYRAVNAGTFYVDFSVESVFPLFGPAQEARWAPGWEPQWLYPERSVAERHAPERGWAFKTSPCSPQERVWYVEQYDPAGHEVIYLVFWPGQMIYRIQVTSVPSEKAGSRKSGTLTTVKYEFVGVSESGNAEVRSRTAHPDEFAKEMEDWARQITSWLQSTGR